MLATLAFIVWTVYYTDNLTIDVSNAFWEGLTAFLVFLVFVCAYRLFNSLEALYMGLFCLFLTRYLTDGYEYFFFFLSGSALYGNFIYNEYRKYNG